MKSFRFYGKREQNSVVKCTILLISCLAVFGCAEVPITHRQSLHLLPNTELLSLSLQEYNAVLKESRLSADRTNVQMVQRVGMNIAKAAESFLKDSGMADKIKDYQWEVSLIKDDKVANAWCMPGGKIAVYTGILPIAQDDSGLAVVLGHEVAHALADHGNERMSQGLLASMGGMAISAALATKPQQTRELFMTVFGVGANVGLLLPYSRLHENEADRIGLILMARAGYDPLQAVFFWERMNKEAGSRPPEFLSTHPAPESRIANIRTYIPEALQYYQKSKK